MLHDSTSGGCCNGIQPQLAWSDESIAEQLQSPAIQKVCTRLVRDAPSKDKSKSKDGIPIRSKILKVNKPGLLDGLLASEDPP